MTYAQRPALAIPVSSVQRNHALEHATLHVLAEKGVARGLAGISDPSGFRVFGDVDTETLLLAAEEALTRLQKGEASLAVHENCGTNLAASGILAGFAGWLGMLNAKPGLRNRLDRLPATILLVIVALLASRSLGPLLQQRLTTRPDVGRMRLLEVQRQQRGAMTVHRILTQQDSRGD